MCYALCSSVYSMKFKGGSKRVYQLKARILNVSKYSYIVFHLILLSYIVINSFFFLSLIFFSRQSIGNNENTKACFNCSILHVHKESFCTKSMVFYNFLNYFFLLSRSVFEIRMLTTQFFTRSRHK